jgi:hypothetical protein
LGARDGALLRFLPRNSLLHIPRTPCSACPSLYGEIIGRFHVTRKEKGVQGATGAPPS